MFSLIDPLLPRGNFSVNFDKLFERFEKFDSIFDSFPVPGMNFKKNDDDKLIVTIEMPGIKETDITINVSNDLVNIKGERRTQISSQSVSKSFSFPRGYDTENVSADLADGILTLTFSPQPNKSKEVKQVTINSKK